MPEDNEVPKSSTEILTELFGVFNAKPPKSESSDEDKVRKKAKKSKKSKKSKKKSKKKHKKKSDSGESSSSSSEDAGDESRKRRLQYDAFAVDSALDFLLENLKKPKVEKFDPDSIPLPDLPAISIKTEHGQPKIKLEKNCLDSGSVKQEKEAESSSQIEPRNDERERMAAVFTEPEADSSDKGTGRQISIRNLINSTVFHDTVKAVEEQEKQEKERKSKYEDGELTESSHSSDSEKDDGDDKKREDRDRKSSDRRSSHSSRSHRKDRRRSKSRERSRRRSRDRDRDYPTSYYGDRLGSSRSRMLPNPASHRSRSRRESGERHRDRSRERGSERPKSIDKHREVSKSRERHSSKLKDDERDKKREKSVRKERDDDGKIDKKRLLAIARKNAVKLVEAGIVPASNLNMKSITSGGKTVNELTEYCKKLSKRERGEDFTDSESEQSDGGEDIAFHHPFQVRDRPNSIVMNIRNAISLPVRSLQEKTAEQSKILRLQFPVSSGSTHRANENEWVPVEPSSSVPALPPPKDGPRALMPPPPAPPPLPLSAVPPPPNNAPVFPTIQPAVPDEKPAEPPADISSIVSKRLDALRALQENPDNRSAKVLVSRTERQLEQWVKTDSRKPRPAKVDNGLFTGSTGARLLSPQQLASGTQAWAKRDQLMTAQPVSGGMGMALLQKMGWSPGEGLGKNKEGSLEPLKLEVKMDKKGLVAFDESAWNSKTPRHVGPALPTVKTLDGKHPVSLLNEYCSRRKWRLPTFEVALEAGPDHRKNFLFKVTVNGVEYKPTVASVNKKQAKAEAAAICLRALGLISPNAT